MRKHINRLLLSYVLFLSSLIPIFSFPCLYLKFLLNFTDYALVAISESALQGSSPSRSKSPLFFFLRRSLGRCASSCIEAHSAQF